VSMYAGCRGVWEVGVRVLPSHAYAGNHGCPSSAVVCYGGWIKQWRNVQRVFSEALAKKDMLRRVSPKIPEGPRLSSRGAPHIAEAICVRGVIPW
jgi:hypothetical protein